MSVQVTEGGLSFEVIEGVPLLKIQADGGPCIAVVIDAQVSLTLVLRMVETYAGAETMRKVAEVIRAAIVERDRARAAGEN